MWQGRDSWTVLQAVPPFLGNIDTLRVSAWAPPSQSWQAENPDHLDSAQSMGVHFAREYTTNL